MASCFSATMIRCQSIEGPATLPGLRKFHQLKAAADQTVKVFALNTVLLVKLIPVNPASGLSVIAR